MRNIVILLLTTLFIACTASQAPETAQDWANAFKAAGLECEDQRSLTGDSLPPGVTSGVQFTIPAYCPDCGGKILVFQSADSVGPMAEWFRSLGQHVYTRDNVLVQINDKAPQAVADQYGAVLNE